MIYMTPIFAEFALFMTPLTGGNVPGPLLLSHIASDGKLGEGLGSALVTTWFGPQIPSSYCFYNDS